MNKTGQQIEDDIIDMVKASPLPTIISGNVHKFGMRPRGSKLEDVVVKFVEGLDGQIQDGTFVINIYVPNIDPYANGNFVRNISRCKALEIAANAWLATLTADVSNYRFRLANTIQTVEDFEINQHFVSVRVRYQLTTF